LNPSDVPDQEPTTDLALPEKASAPAGHAGEETVVDTPLAGPDDATGRVPLPIAAASWPKTSEFGAPNVATPYTPYTPYTAAPDAGTPDDVTQQSPLPPFQPPGGFGPTLPPSHPRPRRSGRRWAPLAAFVAAFAVVMAGVLASLLWPGGGGKHPVAAVTSSASATPGGTVPPAGDTAPGGNPSPRVSAPAGGGGPSTPPQSGPASSGPTATVSPGGPASGGVPPNGLAMPYRTVQQEQGYFEGTVTVTNRTSAPLSSWELSFTYSGAQVRSVWGGVLAQAGSQVIIRNDPTTGSIPPGGTYVVKFGAGGVPSMPSGCRFGGRECGFTP
jgi:Cellulose binding domain